jgi:DNA gyrase subunit A
MPVDEISTVGRNTKGVKIMEVDEGDEVAGVSVYSPTETDDEDEAADDEHEGDE